MNNKDKPQHAHGAPITPAEPGERRRRGKLCLPPALMSAISPAITRPPHIFKRSWLARSTVNAGLAVIVPCRDYVKMTSGTNPKKRRAAAIVWP